MRLIISRACDSIGNFWEFHWFASVEAACAEGDGSTYLVDAVIAESRNPLDLNE